VQFNSKLKTDLIFKITMPKYTEADLLAAIKDVGRGVSQRRAAEVWGIPRQTLEHRLQGTESHRNAAEPAQRLSRYQEDHL
jgi:DNA-binding protein Fis